MTTPQIPPLSTLVLHELLETLDTVANTPHLPLLMGIGCPDNSDSFEVAVAPHTDDIYDALLGLDAPSTWEALLIWVEGSAFRPDDNATREPVRLLFGLTRDGSSISRLQSLEGEALDFGPDRPSEGLLLDCARRVFDLGTPPPPPLTAALDTALWIDEIIVEVLMEPDRDRSWEALAELHPAAADVIDVDPESLARAARRLARASSWHSIRMTAASGRRPELPIEPAVADWMDDGLFARWCLASLPDPQEALPDLEMVLSSEVIDGIRQTVETSG